MPHLSRLLAARSNDLAGRSVVVVGAGPAGLAAGHALARRGARVRVLERAAEVGGRSGWDRVGEWHFDRGAEFLTSFYPRALALVREAGLEGDLVRVPLAGDVVAGGRTAPLPLGAWAILRSRLLSGRTKRRLIGFGFRMSRWRSRLHWGALADAAFLDDQSAAAYFGEAIGEDYVDFVLRPTLESLVLSPAAETSRVVPLSQAREAVGARLFCPRGGLGALWSVLAERLDVACNVDVTAVGRDGAGVRVERASGEPIVADAVIVAVTPGVASRIVAEPVPERALAVDARYSPTVKLHLCLERPFARTRPLCPAGPGAHALAGIGVLESKGTRQAPDGRGGLVLCASPALSAELMDASDDVVADRLIAEAGALLDVPITGVAQRSVVRLREGVPLFYVGWIKRLAELRGQVGPSPIALAGDWLASPSVEGAIGSAHAAVERVAAWLAR